MNHSKFISVETFDQSKPIFFVALFTDLDFILITCFLSSPHHSDCIIYAYNA